MNKFIKLRKFTDEFIEIDSNTRDTIGHDIPNPNIQSSKMKIPINPLQENREAPTAELTFKNVTTAKADIYITNVIDITSISIPIDGIEIDSIYGGLIGSSGWYASGDNQVLTSLDLSGAVEIPPGVNQFLCRITYNNWADYGFICMDKQEDQGDASSFSIYSYKYGEFDVTINDCSKCGSGGDALDCEEVIDEIFGCTDSMACNYNIDNTWDDGSCLYPCAIPNGCSLSEINESYDCSGVCVEDVDCAGVCDGNNILDECGVCNGAGPLDSTTCPNNWNDTANPPCDCDCNIADVCGVCNGDCTTCQDCPCGVIDLGCGCGESEPIPCPSGDNTPGVPCNPGGYTWCGNDGECPTNDAIGDCGGNCLSDSDFDGICDDVDPCVGSAALCPHDPYTYLGNCNTTNFYYCVADGATDEEDEQSLAATCPKWGCNNQCYEQVGSGVCWNCLVPGSYNPELQPGGAGHLNVCGECGEVDSACITSECACLLPPSLKTTEEMGLGCPSSKNPDYTSSLWGDEGHHCLNTGCNIVIPPEDTNPNGWWVDWTNNGSWPDGGLYYPGDHPCLLFNGCANGWCHTSAASGRAGGGSSNTGGELQFTEPLCCSLGPGYGTYSCMNGVLVSYEDNCNSGASLPANWYPSSSCYGTNTVTCTCPPENCTSGGGGGNTVEPDTQPTWEGCIMQCKPAYWFTNWDSALANAAAREMNQTMDEYFREASEYELRQVDPDREWWLDHSNMPNLET